MKALIVLVLFALVSIPALAGQSNCKVATADIGTINGKGKSPAKAFEDAATQCFDRRADLYRMKKGSPPDEETGLLMIDLCANITCS